ncbi:MAG: DUF4405 domain-containing protein [Thermoplasmata archaeon]|nr:DUF4405 domain-containing protein [Thermoplasmata archaeon]
MARETGWNFFGVSKEMLENLHTYAGFAMVLIVAIHLFLNYKMLLNEIKCCSIIANEYNLPQ